MLLNRLAAMNYTDLSRHPMASKFSYSRSRTLLLLAIPLGGLLLYVLLRTDAVSFFKTTQIVPIELAPAGQELSLPPPYASISYAPETPGLCSERYGTRYIRKFSESATESCEHATETSLTCFTHKSHDSRTDSFCIGQPALIDSSARTIGLHCPLRPWTDDDRARGAVPLSDFPAYWYNTGPHSILEQFVNLNDNDYVTDPTSHQQRTVLLVKREDTIDNLWHTLMQVMSVWLSIDILRTTRDPISGKVFYAHHDIETTQVVILDSFENGFFFDLWSMFGDLPVVRLSDFESRSSPTQRIVLPLPGGSNPMWHGDWVDLDCNDSALLKAFSHRMLDFFGVTNRTSLRPRQNDQISLLFIDRKGSRALDDQDTLIEALRSRFPNLKVDLVDFAALSFKQQLEAVASTDILAGVHGAGLTHGMFLKSNSTLVEIRPPGMDHKGFKNMAKFLGHRYFSEHSIQRDFPGMTGDWHSDKVFIETENILELIGEAIASVVK